MVVSTKMCKNSTSPSVMTHSCWCRQNFYSSYVSVILSWAFLLSSTNNICEDFHEKVNDNNKLSSEVLWSHWCCSFLWHILRRVRKNERRCNFCFLQGHRLLFQFHRSLQEGNMPMTPSQFFIWNTKWKHPLEVWLQQRSDCLNCFLNGHEGTDPSTGWGQYNHLFWDQPFLFSSRI